MNERNTLIDLIKTLHPDEFKDLKTFVGQPVPHAVPNNPDAGRLLDIILKVSPDFPEEKLKKKNLYEALYPTSPWVDGRLKKVMIALHKQIQAYLLVQHYFREENAFQRQVDLSDIFQKRGLKNRYDQIIQKTTKDLEGAREKNADHFFQKFRIEYTWSHQALGKNQTRRDLNIQRMLQNLGIFYHIRRLEIINFFLNQQKLTNLDASGPILHAINELPPLSTYFEESGDLFIQQKIFDFQRQTNPSTDDFRELTHWLKRRESSISASALQNAYTFLRNCCHTLIYTGRHEYLEILHELHKDNLERGYLYNVENDNKILSNTFLNIVNVGLITHQFDWVQDFLTTHRNRILGDNETVDFYKLNRAAYLFATGQFESALETLPQSFPNIIYHLITRRLEIKIYYELQSDLLEFKLDAFKMYISRASRKFLSKELRERNADFANLLTQIIQSKPGDPNRKPRLLKRIGERVRAAERDWLMEKVNKMG
jgi:hypothetical protein